MIASKYKSEVIPASFNSLIASSLAFFNNHSSIVIPGFSPGFSACAFKISFFNASTPSTVFALLIASKYKSEVIPAAFNSLIASSLAFFKFHSSIVIPGFSPGFSACAFKISFFNDSTPSTVFALLIASKYMSEVIPASFNSLIASSLAFFNNHSSIVIPGFSPGSLPANLMLIVYPPSSKSAVYSPFTFANKSAYL